MTLKQCIGTATIFCKYVYIIIYIIHAYIIPKTKYNGNCIHYKYHSNDSRLTCFLVYHKTV